MRDFNIATSTETKTSHFPCSNKNQETKGSGITEQRSRGVEVVPSKNTSKRTRINKGENRPKPSNKHLLNQSLRQEAAHSSEAAETKTYVNEAKTVKRDKTIGSSRTQYKTYDIRIPVPADTEISANDTGSESCTETGLNRRSFSMQKKVLFYEPTVEHVSTQRSYSTQTCAMEDLDTRKQNETNVNRNGAFGGDSMEVLNIDKSDHFQQTMESKQSKQELALLRQSIHHSIDLETVELEKDLQEMRLRQNDSIIS